MLVKYVGHAGFLVESSGLKVALDPWIEGNPSAAKGNVGMDVLEGVDYALVTHSHGDHGLVEAIEASKRWGTEVVGVFELANHAQSEGAKAIGANVGGPVSLRGAEVVLTQALHSSSLGVPVGFVVSTGEVTFYHAGDTGVFPGMALLGELYRPEVAMLPIGGHYTMGPREAAKAVELLGAGKVVPMHYGTFPVLRGTPAELRAALRDRGIEAEVVEFEPGEEGEI